MSTQSMPGRNRTRRTTYETLLIVGMLAGFFLLFFGGSGKFTIRRDEAWVQKKADTYVPTLKPIRVPLTLVTITIDSIQIHLNNEADLLVAMTGHRLMGKTFTMVVHAIGQPDFEHSKNGEFFFRSTKVDIVDFSYSGPTSGALLSKIRDRYVTNQGIKNLITDITPHVEDWMRVSAEHAAIYALQHFPIVRLKDEKGFFLNAALKDVSVQGNQIVATFNAWTVGLAVIGAIVVVLVCLGIFILILANPEIGLIFLLLG